jgi:hypothetical protein
MRGLEVPQEVVEALGGGKRPAVAITINGHSWRSRAAIMRGRYLIGLSNANRKAAGIVTGDEVEVKVEFDREPRVVAEPADLARVLDADRLARAAYNRLPYGLKLQHVRSIESAKKPETRRRRIEKAIAALRDPGSSRPPGRKLERDGIVIVTEQQWQGWLRYSAARPPSSLATRIGPAFSSGLSHPRTDAVKNAVLSWC